MWMFPRDADGRSESSPTSSGCWRLATRVNDEMLTTKRETQASRQRASVSHPRCCCCVRETKRPSCVYVCWDRHSHIGQAAIAGERAVVATAEGTVRLGIGVDRLFAELSLEDVDLPVGVEEFFGVVEELLRDEAFQTEEIVVKFRQSDRVRLKRDSLSHSRCNRRHWNYADG